MSDATWRRLQVLSLARFIPSVSSATPIAPPEAIENIRAVVQLGSGTQIVATDANGRVIVTTDRDALPQRARAQLAYHEVASAGRALELNAQELYIFDLQTIEMLPDAPGLNDALYVYGLMYAPRAKAPVEGQLTVTRADLLGALVDGVQNAFLYPPDAHGSRAAHALLPGDRADVLALGRGIILALPLAPTWLPECPLSNDLVAAQLLYDVLAALRRELGVKDPLPVPSRATIEAELVAQGWKIEGDEAVRAKSTGLLGALRGSEKKRLPRQGTLDELVAEARAVLANLPGVPTAEAVALRARIGGSQRIKIPITPAPVQLPPATQPRPRVESDRGAWMKDFVDAHRAPSRPPPRVSTPARAISKDATPPWMEDFAEPATPGEHDEDEAPKPDWSSDFE